jgi:type IV pilus assembly protein PilY1
MLHVFNADTGAELWSYIPSFVIPNLNGLSKISGFTHKYFVDGTPAVGDVDMKNTVGANGNGTDWRTIVVGGLGKGGNGFYALDVTNPSAGSESAAASKVLWEFPNSATQGTYGSMVGYSFGKPIIVKTAASGWVVLVTSGYNNGDSTGGDGQGYLFVLNARTGAVIKAISTGVGSASSPSGLTYISAYVENADVDNTTDYVYGGDLLGNVWRFDLSDSNTNRWSVTKLASLVDAAGNAQPVTTSPELAKISTPSGFKRMVYVGTGRYLGNSDVPGSVSTQTMYGLVDDTTTTPLISPLRSSLQAQTFVTSTPTSRTASANTVDYATKGGWYIDLPSTGERINTDPTVGNSVLAFVTNIPSSDSCVPGGSSWIYFLDFKTGGKVDDPAAYSSTYLGNSLGSRPVLIQLPSGAIKALVRQSDASTNVLSTPSATPIGGVRRVSWREIPDA